MNSQDQKKLIARPPVVVIMGHIDHGKSTLLDYIRKTEVVKGEAGGITQHVAAYQAEHASADGKKHLITFLDTPGHEAFCAIRERGAEAADIAILAVSAEDGVKPQTIEAFKAIQTSKIPYVVAITKTDKPNANIEKTKTSLGENQIYVEGWGGDVPCVEISSTTGKGVSELLDMVVLVSELANLTTDSDAPAHGIVIESTLDTQKGVSATLLVKDGVLKIGSFVIAGLAYAPVRFIEDFMGKKIESAGASTPVSILGWNTLPVCGDEFKLVPTKKEAEKLVEEFKRNNPKKSMPAVPAKPAKAVLAEGEKEEEAVSVVTLPIIIKADVIGSLEGVKYELAKIAHDRVKLKIISEGIGNINENDVKTAQSDPTVLIIGFNVTPEKKAAAIIERAPAPINVKSFKVIYELAEYVRNALTTKIPKEYIEEVTGRAKILALFSKDKDRQIIGGKVESGTISSGNEITIMRRSAEIGRGRIRELQEKKARTSEVAEGHEFGMQIEAKIEIAVGDRIEAVRTVEKLNG